jgi:crotonobetainyl-CoA:carnitine CoA-transferase CaiB-like acyl-CoA transferase
MLGPYRVLDLSDERGWFAGFLLAQLGADVVLVEPPGGWPRGYEHEAYNRGKRSVVAADAKAVALLAADADIVLHNDGLPFDVDLSALRAESDRLVTVHITPWGETGPKAHWRATDLTLFASSGQLAVTGDSDRPPVRISIPQAWLHGASQAAVAALVALEHRARTGVGQHVDLSTQQAVCETALSAVLYAPSGLPEVEREAGGIKFGPALLRSVYPCVDGHVVITIAFGPMIGPMFRRFMEWVFEEGFCDRATLDTDWVNYALLLQAGDLSIQDLEELMDLVARFALTKTKAEIQERGLRDSLLVCPVNDLQDVLDSPQLADRGFWDGVDGARLPGPIVSASRTPLRRLISAPIADQHRDDLAPDPGLEALRAVSATIPEGAASDRPLAGLKVADLAWVAAAPLATKILAHFGATVVRVETQNRPCLLRGALGHRDDIPEQENAIAWHSTNANKRTIALDLSKPEAREVVRDLVGWAPRFTVVALLAAVDHHRRTGEGQHLDFSQMESAIHLLTPALLELQDTGRKRTRRGNDDDHLAPHGVYPVCGEDRWVAIVVEDDEQWRSLCIEMRRSDLADLDTPARLARRSELDETLAAWTAGQMPAGLAYRLQAHGIAAHHVQNSDGCLDDPQLNHREHFEWVPHQSARRAVVDGVPYKMSAAHSGFDWAGPTYGEHSMEVLEDLLGYDGERIAELAIAEALE